MVNACAELQLWGLEGVIFGEGDVDEEDAILVERSWRGKGKGKGKSREEGEVGWGLVRLNVDNTSSRLDQVYPWLERMRS